MLARDERVQKARQAQRNERSPFRRRSTRWSRRPITVVSTMKTILQAPHQLPVAEASGAGIPFRSEPERIHDRGDCGVCAA